VSIRREYRLELGFNERRFTRIVIDSHYQESHPDMTDQIILDLVLSLDGQVHPVRAQREGFSYVSVDQFWRKGKTYRVILTYCEEDFLGVINAFRVKENKK
jgi:hypothetical protein